MSDRDFKEACGELNGLYSETDGTKVCKIGSKQVDILAYNEDKEQAIIKDHQDREKKIDKVDEISRGTNWVNIERPENPIVITNVGGEVKLHDFREE